MTKRLILTVLLVPTLFLLVPLIGMQVSEDVVWTASDFVVAWVLMAGVGFLYSLAAQQTGSRAYRFAVAAALGSAFLLMWANLAVGLIGNENNPANLLYLGVFAIGIIGAIIARSRAEYMARTLFAMAAAQALVPVVAMIIWKPRITSGVVQVIGVNAFFVILFIGSALLFRRANTSRSTSFPTATSSSPPDHDR